MPAPDVPGPRRRARLPRLLSRLAGPFTAALAGAALLCASLAGAGPAAAQGPVAAPVPAATAAPGVIPSLHGWTPGSGTLHIGARSRIATDAASAATARLLAGDLRAQGGRTVAVVRGVPRPGDIVLRAAPSRTGLGAEGYTLAVGNEARITGRTQAGVFYGTRTLLQLLASGPDLARGTTTDVPSSGERAVGVCACYTYNTDAWLTRLIKDMAYLKLNTLHLELKVKSSEYPAVNTFSYYTPREVRAVVATAARYHVTVIPEINSPGHMDPYLAPYPDLQLKDAAGTPDPTRLDITNQDAFTFYTHLVDTDLKLFPGPYFHMGADEYMINSAYSDYPQLLDYARKKFGPDATPQDAYIDFVNRVDAYVRAKGRTLRIWNDGLTGDNTVPLNKDIVVEHWLPEKATSQQLLDDGYRVMNATDGWYYVRGSYQPDAQKMYDSAWTPADFADGTATSHQDGITGAEYMVWPDNYGKETENQAQQGMSASLRVFAQEVWGGARPAGDYAAFTALADALGHAPGRGPAWVQPVPSGTYRLAPAQGGSLTAGPSAAPGTPLTITRSASSRWTLTATDDGYYVLTDPATGLCADVSRGVANAMHVVEQAGATATVETCDGAASQKWQLEPVTGGYRLVDAITQQTLVAAPDGAPVVQQPRDVARHDVWHVAPALAR